MSTDQLRYQNCEDELLDLAKCPLCKKVNSDIKTLPCVDLCCLECLQGRCRGQRGQNGFVCPSCSRKFAVPDTGLQSLPSLVYVKAVLPALKRSVMTNDSPTCSGCDSDRQATKFCKECRKYLCMNCLKVHGALRPTQRHHVVDRRQCVLTDYDSVRCGRHPAKSLEVYCTDCDDVCCIVCLRDTHRGHAWSDVDDVESQYRHRLTADISVVQTAIDACDDQLRRLTEAANSLDTQVRQIGSRIDEAKDDLIAAVEAEIQDMHETLNSAKVQYTGQLEDIKEALHKQLKILKCFEQFCQNVVETGTVHEVIRVFKALHAKQEEFPLLQATGDVPVAEISFARANMTDKLPHDSKQLIGSIHTAQSLQNGKRHDCSDASWDELLEQLTVARQNIALLEEEKNEAECTRNQTEQRLITAEESVARQQTEIQKMNKQLEQKTRQAEELEKQLNDARGNIAKQQTELKRLSEQLGQAASNCTTSSTQVTFLQQQLCNSEQKHVDIQLNFQSKLDDKQSEMELAQARQRELANKLERAEERAANCERAVEETTVQLNGRLSNLEDLLQQSTVRELKATARLQEAQETIDELTAFIEGVPPIAVQICTVLGDVPVYGLACLADELYVIRAWSSDVEVYDATTYLIQRRLQVLGLIDVTDMTSCDRYRCLYITDFTNLAVFRVFPSSSSVSQWRISEKPTGVSVSPDHHAVVAFGESSTLRLFTHDGILVKIIRLQPDVVQLRRAVALDTGQFVVCHGRGSASPHRVCIVDAEGQVTASFGTVEQVSSRLDWPAHVDVDDRGFIYVADYNNTRVVQLDADLRHVTDVIGPRDGIRKPRCVCVDSTRQRLYLAENGGRLLVFGLRRRHSRQNDDET